ncbi:MAG: hypothetical protein RhofKO_15380 [Rhodothermales bacterium]
MGVKDLFLQKGWAGTTIDRPATVDRVNPLIERHLRLNHGYEYAIRTSTDAQFAAQLGLFQRIARMDAGKMAEIVYSNGGVAFNGTQLEANQFDLGTGDAIAYQLLDAEQAFQDALQAEFDAGDHHMRTRGVLTAIQRNSAERLDYLKELTRGKTRPA